MLSEAQIQSVALFFHFALLENKLAHGMAFKTIQKLQSRLKHAYTDGAEVPSVIVEFTQKAWKQAHKTRDKSQIVISADSGWRLPANVELGPWMEFKKQADEDEFLAVLWAKVLQFSEANIAQGLNLTEGTVRHRVGRGLRRLGSIVQTRSSV